MVGYQYDPLPGNAYIRLVTLHPGHFKDPIVVSFQTSPFSSETPPQYEALSYTWGSEQHPLPIYVGTEDHATTLTLWNVVRAKFKRFSSRRNLVVALRHLRYVDKPRVMWIDALCINQADDVEKGSQVAMMGDIFRLAHRVVAWIGPEENNSDHAMGYMDFLGSQVEVDYMKPDMGPAKDCTDPSIGDLTVPLVFDYTTVVAVYHLISRQWFSRVWVQQEVALANSEAIVQCGSYQIKWSSFRRALACIYMKAKGSPASTEKFFPDLVPLTGFFFGTSRTSIINIRANYGKLHCLDPRDRIYAVSAVLSEHEKALVSHPDYTKPYAEIYTHVVTRFIETHRGLNILNQCDLRENSPCPSWVPDWSDTSASVNRVAGVHIQASSQLGASFEFPEPTVLRVTGVSKSKVRECYPIPNIDKNSFPKSIEAIRSLALELDIGKQNTIEEFTRTLVEDAFSNNYDVPLDVYLDIDEAKHLISLIMSGHEFSDEDQVWPSPIMKLLRVANLSGAPFIRTTDGSIGTGPRGTQLGDEVCVILGCSFPILLRPHGNGKYKLVGSCFVASIMQGEAFLGPLPENIRLVEAFDDVNNILTFWFKDVHTGEISYGDPRLKLLPMDIGRYLSYLAQHRSGAMAFNPKVLQDIGVDLKQIDIV